MQYSAPVHKPKLSNGLTENVEICNPDDGLMEVLKDDDYLKPFEDDLKLRQREFRK